MEEMDKQMKTPFINDSHELNFDGRKPFGCTHMCAALFLVIHV